ncbi:MAG: alpha/beta hydrolase, partial [Thermoanaerobaculia bacterium]
EVRIPSERVTSDLPYWEGSDDPKHRLDLYQPQGERWSIVIFVHGGGWTAGAKDLVVSGGDIYGNIGRFLASRGIGAAVISYRLQPTVTWREQVADVARAVAWVHAHAEEYGGDPEALFLSGHSAGAQLSAYVALAPEPLTAVGLSPEVLCGAIPVSGAGYDLADEETYDIGAPRAYYEERFRAGDPGDDWLHEASATTYVSPDAPPFLLIHGTKEWESLKHQNRLLDQALRQAGADSRLVAVKGQSHGRIVLALSKDDTIPSTEFLSFVRGADC